jgi:hypothetical protein
LLNAAAFGKHGARPNFAADVWPRGMLPENMVQHIAHAAIKLSELKGRERVKKFSVRSLVVY